MKSIVIQQPLFNIFYQQQGSHGSHGCWQGEQQHPLLLSEPPSKLPSQQRRISTMITMIHIQSLFPLPQNKLIFFSLPPQIYIISYA